MSNPSSPQPITAAADLSILPPDLVILSATLFILQLFDIIQRNYINPFFPSYSSLPFRDRFDWERRFLNLLFQIIQAPFNAYILLLDRQVSTDYIYGYSTAAHVGFIVIIAFYIYDTIGIVMHPAAPSNSPMWLFHHSVAVVLLLYNVSYRKCSAFPAAAFLISGAGHIMNELRWLCTAMNVQSQRVLKTCHIFYVLVCILTCGLPPPFLLLKCARQLGIPVFDLVIHHMQPYCNFVFILIYVPHVVLIFYQAWRAYRLWGTSPIPFRQRKFD